MGLTVQCCEATDINSLELKPSASYRPAILCEQRYFGLLRLSYESEFVDEKLGLKYSGQTLETESGVIVQHGKGTQIWKDGT